MPVRIEIRIEETRCPEGKQLSLHLESYYHERTEREEEASRYVIREFREAQIRYGKESEAKRIEISERDAPGS